MTCASRCAVEAASTVAAEKRTTATARTARCLARVHVFMADASATRVPHPAAVVTPTSGAGGAASSKPRARSLGNGLPRSPGILTAHGRQLFRALSLGVDPSQVRAGGAAALAERVLAVRANEYGAPARPHST